MFLLVLLAFFLKLASCCGSDDRKKQIEALNKKYKMRYLGKAPFTGNVFADVSPEESLLICKNKAVAYDNQRWGDIVSEKSCNFPEYDEFTLKCEELSY